DNGTDSCLSELPAKNTLYEGGIHVPLVVAGQQDAKAGAGQAALTTSDVFPGLADSAGVELGRSLPRGAVAPGRLRPFLRQPARLACAGSSTRAGMGARAPLPACPPATVCQAEVGCDGPGAGALSICGLPLYGVSGANLVPVRLSGVPPGADVTLRIGDFSPA